MKNDFTRLLGFSPNDWAFDPTTRLFTRLLGFSSDYWAFHPTTGLFTQLLGISTTTGPSPKNQCLTLMAGMSHFHPLNIVSIPQNALGLYQIRSEQLQCSSEEAFVTARLHMYCNGPAPADSIKNPDPSKIVEK